MSARSILISTCGQVDKWIDEERECEIASQQAPARQDDGEDHVSGQREDDIPISQKLLRWSRGFGGEGAPQRVELRHALAQPDFPRQRILQAEYRSY